ncbi:hypothetical protein KKD52_17725 [Myxococcota bacterium]|nr:hypothetical protein [Myxococcota bacterium]
MARRSKTTGNATSSIFGLRRPSRRLFLSFLHFFRNQSTRSPDNPIMTHAYKPFPEQNWPHSPVHWFFHPGIYMVTASTYRRLPIFNTSEKLHLLQNQLFRCTSDFHWELEAWALLNNHYHLVLRSSDGPENCGDLLRQFHSFSAREVNGIDGTPGRRVWFQYWDSRITYQNSYMARLAYVHANAVHHKLVHRPEDYPWSSAAWFVRNAPKEFVEQVIRFRMDRIRVYDDF